MLYALIMSVLSLYLMYRMLTSIRERFAIMGKIMQAEVTAEATGQPVVLDNIKLITADAIHTFLLVISGALLIAPFAVTAFSDSPSPTPALVAQWLALLGSLVLLAVSLLKVIRKPEFVSGFCSFAGLTLAFMFANSLTFVMQENTGVLNYHFLSTTADTEGLDCESGVMLLQIEKRGDAASWRCPNDLVLLGNTSKPFIPWPSYTKGHSVQVNDAVLDMMESAGKSQPETK